jgi:hypothetical protein
MDHTKRRFFRYSTEELTASRKYIHLDAADDKHDCYRAQSRLFNRATGKLAGLLETINYNAVQTKDGGDVNIVRTVTTLTLYETTGVSILLFNFLYSSVGTQVLTSSTTATAISGSGVYEGHFPVTNIVPIRNGKARLVTIN